MYQKVTISNKRCSFQLYTYQIILKKNSSHKNIMIYYDNNKNKCFLSTKSAY